MSEQFTAPELLAALKVERERGIDSVVRFGDVAESMVKAASDRLSAVLDAIVAEGHTDVMLHRHDDGQWYCSSRRLGEPQGLHESDADWVARIEAMRMGYGDTAIEAAKARLKQVLDMAAKRKEAP